MGAEIEELARIFLDSNNMVFFGGAGVSTASGIPDFRGSDGIFCKRLNRMFTPSEAVSHSFLDRHPGDFYDFYRHNLIYPEAKPNACHFVLAELERMGKLKAVITQNIDGLHQAAGSEKVCELHGTAYRYHCNICGIKYSIDTILQSEGVPRCKCGGVIRPNVILYQEPLEEEVVETARQAIEQAETLIIGGTSLIVYPATGLISYFEGERLVLINKTKTIVDRAACLLIREDIATVMKEAFVAAFGYEAGKEKQV